LTDAPNPRSQPYHHGDLPNALIAAGISILAEEGTAGLDLRKVARRAGVSHAAPYRHFADKNALLVAIAIQGFAQLETRMHDALAQAGPGLQATLLALGRAYLGFGLDNPAHMREMFSGVSVAREPGTALYDAAKRCYLILEGLLAQHQPGGAPPEKVARVAHIAWSTFHGLTILLIEGQMPGLAARADEIERTVLLAAQMVYTALVQGL
jgi:AcrR family transcriptional regulator